MQVTAKLVKLVLILGLVASSSACGEFTREGRSPAILVVRSLLVARGDTPDDLVGNLLSDVQVLRTEPTPCTETSPCPTIFNDVGEVSLSIVLKDQGTPGIGSAPSLLNTVTITRYHVDYRRTD